VLFGCSYLPEPTGGMHLSSGRWRRAGSRLCDDTAAHSDKSDDHSLFRGRVCRFGSRRLDGLFGRGQVGWWRFFWVSLLVAVAQQWCRAVPITSNAKLDEGGKLGFGKCNPRVRSLLPLGPEVLVLI